MYAKLTHTNAAAIIGDINTFLTSTIPSGDRWTSYTLNYGSNTGKVFTSTGSSSPYEFPLHFGLFYNTDDNYVKMYTADVMDVRIDGTKKNLFTDPSFEAAALGDWDIFDPSSGGFDIARDATPYFGTYSGKTSYIAPSPSFTDLAAIYQNIAAVGLTAAATNVSCYVKAANLGSDTADIKFLVQDSNGSPAVDPTGGNLKAPDSITTLEDGWYFIEYDFTPGGIHSYYVGVTFPVDTEFFIDGGLLVNNHSGGVPNVFTLYTGSGSVVGTPLREASDGYEIFFTDDVSAMVSNDIVTYVNATADYVALVIGNENTVSPDADLDEMYDAGFYGRMIVPSGNPADATNTTGVDVTAITIGSTSYSRANNTFEDGQFQVYRDAGGRFWTTYNCVDISPEDMFWWKAAKYDYWGMTTSLNFVRDLFMDELYWKTKINILSLFLPREGFRGYLPAIFTMDAVLGVRSDIGKIYINPKEELYRGTCDAGGNSTTLNDTTGVDFTTDIHVGDVAYHIPLGEYRRITNVAATALTTAILTAGPGGSEWDDNEYIIYRRAVFNVFKVGFALGTTVLDSVGGDLGDFTGTCFTPYNRRKDPRSRRRAIVLSQN